MANTWEFNFINDGHLLSVQTLALGSSLLIFFSQVSLNFICDVHYTPCLVFLMSIESTN